MGKAKAKAEAKRFTAEEVADIARRAADEAVAQVNGAKATTKRSTRSSGRASAEALVKAFGKSLRKTSRGNEVYGLTAGDLPEEMPLELIRGKTGLYAIIPNGTRVTVRKGKLVAAK